MRGAGRGPLRPRSAERVRGYGADHVIDYTATPVVEAAKGRSTSW
ncbi:hypothetical protein [Streptomyces sp. 900116325]